MTLVLPRSRPTDLAPPAPVFPPQEGCRWHVLHTKSRQEKALAETLDAMAIACFLPLARQKRYYGRRKIEVDLPLFPGYLFLYGTLEQAYSADRTKRVAHVIPVVDQARLDDELRQIHLAIAGHGQLDPYPYLTRNVRVQVIAGPLKGLRGVVEDRLKRDRLILQVDVLGQATSLEIDGSLLEPID